MSSIQPALSRWWRSDRKILSILALYGLAAGAIAYAAGLLDDESLGRISLVANFPTVMALYFASGGYSPVPDAVRIPSSIVIWSLVGLIAYTFVKMLRLGP